MRPWYDESTRVNSLEEATTQAKVLRDLLVDIRNGYALYAPVLVKVQEDGASLGDVTMEHTITSHNELDWAEQYAREYSHEAYAIVGSNSLRQGLDTPVTIGRSRKCGVRVENDSVSKVHAAIVFDRGSGGYFLTDKGSRNGTCINSEPVMSGVRTPLWSGAYVSFGDAVYVFIDPPTMRRLARLTVTA